MERVRRMERKLELFPDIHVHVIGVRRAHEIDTSRAARDKWLPHVERVVVGADEL